MTSRLPQEGKPPHRFVKVQQEKKPADSAYLCTRRTFLQIPARMRRGMKIPPWYAEVYGVQSLVLRTKACRLTSRQKTLALLARMYYIWIFNVVPVYGTVPGGTSSRIRASFSDGMSSLLWQCFHTKHWYSHAARLHARLKVLLCPITGW